MSDFWARRKAAVAKEAEAELAAVQAAEVAQSEAQVAERGDEELLAEAKQPAPEELDSPEAVREFMNSALPQRLKTRALRRLWTLNPVLANLDGLVDYGEDFTDAACVVENLQTTYQVGKGMLAHLEAMAAKAEAEDAEAGDEAEDGPAPDPDPEPLALAEADAEEEEVPDQVRDTSAPEQSVLLAEAPEVPPGEVLPRAPRRMTFRFEEHV